MGTMDHATEIVKDYVVRKGTLDVTRAFGETRQDAQ